jgi:iron complex transport system permease protein
MNRRSTSLWITAAATGVAALVLPWVGAERIDAMAALRGLGASGAASPDAMILWSQRIPRVLLALIVGGGLATSGAALQVLFRNPLAEPWTLGIAGGAALGAFTAHLFPALRIWVGPLSSVQALALLGAAAVLAFMLAVCRRPRGPGVHVLLLGGITISILCSGLVAMMVYFVSPFEFMSLHRWMTGGLDVLGYRDLGALALLAGPGLALLFSQMREYNHLALGTEVAMGHGVDTQRVLRRTVLGVGLVTAGVVSLAGPIGFVGMLVPHAARALAGTDHRRMLPVSFLLGGTVLAVCDAVGRTVLAPTELPVGIVTAVCGAPLFLAVLFRRR